MRRAGTIVLLLSLLFSCALASADSSSAKSFIGTTRDSDHVFLKAFKVVRTVHGKKTVTKQIEVTIARDNDIEYEYSDQFLTEQQYMKLYQSLGEWIYLSAKWKGRLLQEDQKVWNIRNSEASKQEGMDIADIYIELDLDRAGHHEFLLTLPQSFYLTFDTSSPRELWSHLGAAINWENAQK